MRNRVFKAMCKVPMNLQLFAESGDGAGDSEGNGGGSGEGTGGEGGDNPPSFDDFLKTGSNQAEFDRRVQKAVNTAVTNAQEKWQALTDDKLSEADKLAKMTKEEKAQYMQKKKEKELSDREAAVTRSELMAEAKNNLSDEGLPVELVASLILCPVALLILCTYYKAAITWYYIVASVIAAFIVYLVATGGWEKVKEIWERTKYKNSEGE